ncbi:MAG: YihY/virulence factor BrkB family protein, partial [Candidatus Rokuibacteriota bacterium]
MGRAWSLLGATLSSWYEDRAQRLGAALAYYTIFALAPGLIILIPLSGLAIGREAAQSQILEQIRYLIGEQGAEAVRATIESARSGDHGLSVTGLALATLVFGLWGVFGELQDALNAIWGVAPKPGRGLRQIVKERFLS